MNAVSHAAVIEETRHWLDRLVIGLGLCPFAAKPFREDRIAYRVSGAAEDDGIYQDFLGTVQALLAAGPERQETALLIVPGALGQFDDYLDMLEVLERSLAEAGLVGAVQLASFHPDYRFEGAPADDPANYSNRSPFPTFHLIREAGLSAALETYPDAEAIPARNVARLRELGVVGIQALLDGD